MSIRRGKSIQLSVIFFLFSVVVGCAASTAPAKPEATAEEVGALETDEPWRPHGCGPIALSIVLEQLGSKVEEEDVAKIKGPEASMLDLAKIARGKGFDAIGLEVSFEELQRLDPPVILHYTEGHFCVLMHCDRTTVGVRDGTVERLLPRREFEKLWSGFVLVVRKKTQEAGKAPEVAHDRQADQK